ncbi:ABC transporter permease [Methanobacterium sp.]|uniref:ABC transporter permease n=1 Tax=Methanobacterium sp. TaxID=2164 RepID=UPI003C7150EE
MSRIIIDMKYSFIETFNDKINIFLLFILPTFMFLLLGNVLGGLGSQLPDNIASGMSYFDFLLPGILAFFIMTAAQMAAGTIVHYRRSGVFRKLSTTPISNMEWIAARIIMWTILTLLTLAVAIFAAWLIIGIHPNINLISLLLMVAGTALFAGMGILIANFVKNEEASMTITLSITFLLTLVSGTFIPVETMSWPLQYLAKISPLTYLSEGLRSSMITGNTGDAFTDLLIVTGIGIILFGVGVALFNWKED